MKRITQICSSWLLLLVLCLPADAQKMKFELAFDIGGEPSFAITQDRDGFLWFGSFFNGLVRFDGTSVTCPHQCVHIQS